MSSSMKAYLAEKYMSGPKADAILERVGPKKKKRKLDGSTAAASSSALIKDDDAGFGGAAPADDDALMQDADDAVVEASDRSFRKRKSGWTTVRAPTPPPAPDELPIVVDATEDTGPPPLKGGLVSAAAFRRAQPAQQAGRDEEAARQAEETVYRDATGRRIDTKAERAEAARKRREQEELEARKMEWGKGVVQREEEERRRLEEEKEKTRGMARYADDEDLNDMQKEQMRWNDPAAAFLTKGKSKGPKKPEYKGPTPAPNRFGIKPGYRWDGVDRSNGFEKKFFQRQNERQRTGAESYNWSVEDM